jgi:hypothetical protein
MKRPDFIVQVSAMKRPDLGDFLKYKYFRVLRVSCILQELSSAQIFRLLDGPLLGRTNVLKWKCIDFF